jgi:phage-related protein
MATFTWIPSNGSSVTHAPKVNRAKFGDGYEQRSLNGINTDPRMWQLMFQNRETSEADAIAAFLKARKGFESFDWTPSSGSAGKFICVEWTDSHESAGYRSINATFEEVFGE